MKENENVNVEMNETANAEMAEMNKTENAEMAERNDGKVVLCAANAYEQKYYFNEVFKGMPDSIKDELHIICVLFTEEVGGIFSISFDEDGGLLLETDAAEEDILYDEISSGLLVGEIKRKRQDLLESLSLYYKVFVLKQDLDSLLEE